YMEVQETSRRRSPFVLNRILLHRKVSVRYSGLGRAYLAFQDETTRQDILRVSDTPRKARRGMAELDNLLARIRADGYACRDIAHYSRRSVQAHLNAIAVPIMGEHSAIAAVNIIWIASATPEAEMVRMCLPRLRATAEDIAKAFRTKQQEVLSV